MSQNTSLDDTWHTARRLELEPATDRVAQQLCVDNVSLKTRAAVQAEGLAGMAATRTEHVLCLVHNIIFLFLHKEAFSGSMYLRKRPVLEPPGRSVSC